MVQEQGGQSSLFPGGLIYHTAHTHTHDTHDTEHGSIASLYADDDDYKAILGACGVTAAEELTGTGILWGASFKPNSNLEG